MGGPLSGKTVLVTRTKEQAASFSTKILIAGGNPIEIPMIVTRAPEDTTPMDRAIQEIDSFDWVVFTSTNGVAFFLEAMETTGHDSSLLAHKKVAVVGKKTAEYLKEMEIPIALQPDEFVAEAFLEVLLDAISPTEKVLFPKGNLARDVIETGLIHNNIAIQSVVAYETTTNYRAKEMLISRLRKKEIDVVTFTSPSTVHAFMELAKNENLQDIIFACIGPISEQALREYISEPIIVAKEYTTEGILTAIIDNL